MMRSWQGTWSSLRDLPSLLSLATSRLSHVQQATDVAFSDKTLLDIAERVSLKWETLFLRVILWKLVKKKKEFALSGNHVCCSAEFQRKRKTHC